jgi:hypothetical protein
MGNPKDARGSDYIPSLKELMSRRPVTEIGFFDRVSSRNEAVEKLEDRRGPLLRLAESHGVKVAIGIDRKHLIFGEVGSGWVDGPRHTLYAALRAAEEHGGIPLVAPCITRFGRSKRFHSIDRPNAQLSKGELDELVGIAESYGVPLATLLHPASTPEQERQFLAALSKEGTGRVGGRPEKRGRPCLGDTRNKANWESRLRELVKSGCCVSEAVKQIAEEAGVRIRSAYRWVNLLGS